ncbi:probable tRNA N6-adenosine threonylcarbamoyltransferase, mitochondrial [Leguminivora glycinivorella]|uniref:probable tRNA N6-adenosine threonylcarbamoyltransferase, mitochondrial n=1 Tax=Leguminivora glycinivorella TaxID=1035111 RepID=UPI00200FA308|nr:probable tRNA N6-adenosine threonylcarbamoyltransferase, mitochondrial [Leguminivora glycinivorella]
MMNYTRSLFNCVTQKFIQQRKIKIFNNHRNYSGSAILGIETSCDDTGCAIVSHDGKLLSESLHSQNLMHLRNGGIIPDVAQDLHKKYIEPTVNDTLQKAKLTMQDISAIAVTLRPGLALSLVVGMKYAKYLSRLHKKPIIPIHHMEAHALAARMHHNISFPFLVSLISGGHCLLAVAQDVNHFQLLGQSMDIAPGEVFDKVARRMKLRNIAEYSKICGGQAIELAASKATNPHVFKLPLARAEYRDCNFNFNGLKTSVIYQLHRKEQDHNIVADKLILEVNDLCAALLMAVSRHLVHRTQRAMEFCEQNNLIPKDNKQLVVSGGVACNNYIFNALTYLCGESDYKIYRPLPKLCTDNGVMIAWNGLEKWRRSIDITTDISKLDIQAASPLGESLINEVVNAKIPTKLMKIKI